MTQRTTEQKIQAVDGQLMLLFTDDPRVDWKLLSDLTGGIVTKDASPGNGLEIAKAIARYNRHLLSQEQEPARKRPGRKPKAKPAEEVKVDGNQPAKKRRGRPPKNAQAAASAPAPTPEVTPTAE